MKKMAHQIHPVSVTKGRCRTSKEKVALKMKKMAHQMGNFRFGAIAYAVFSMCTKQKRNST